MNRVELGLFLALLSAVSLPAGVVVSPAGSDENPGTEQRPVRTLERARELIRAAGGGTVFLRGGVYERTSTLALTTEDSNTIWLAWPEEEPRLTGSRTVRGFRSSDAGKGLYEVDLRAAGITDFGKLSARGFGRAMRASALELFYRGEPMPLAGWPNTGWAYTSGAPKGPQGGEFSVQTQRLKNWMEEPDLWVHGYWTQDWADSYEHVAAIDADAGVIRTDPPHGVYGYAAGKRFRVVNARSELDAPGEWYLDRAEGKLYFIPPGELHDGDVAVSLLETPLITITNANNVRLAGLTFEASRGTGVEIRGGDNNVVSWCAFRNLGVLAVRVEGGTANGIEESDITNTGEGGVVLSGGDRRTLTPSYHFASGNRFQRYSRWVRTYRPAVQVSGVGQEVRRNLIRYGPHEGIALSGNDHLIEGNDIHTVAWETQDVGAFYMGRDWTWRGNIIRGNFFHNQGNGDVNSVYLDDCASGTVVEGNLFHRARRSVFIGGGRDNIVRNNLFIEGSPAVEVDARGMTWARKWFDGSDNTLWDRLKAVPYQQPPWSERYPELVNIANDEPAAPKGNVIEGNASYAGRWSNLRDGTDKWVAMRNNYTAAADDFADAARNDFRLREGAAVAARGFSFQDFRSPGDAGDVINHRMEAVAGKANTVRLIVENLGLNEVSGEVQVWSWPEQVRAGDGAAIAYRLGPGQKLERDFAVEGGGAKEAWIGTQIRGDDLRPPALKLTLR